MTVFPADAVLFDCDGVLVDSDAAVVDAWTRWAGDLGLSAADVVAAAHGQRSADTVAQFAGGRPDALERIDGYEVESAAAVTAIPGARELTASMPAGHWAVVTSGRTELALARLAAAGITRPAVLVCADDVARGKPDSEGYLAAAARLGVAPATAIVVEDAPAGIAAARAAGVGAVLGVGERARSEPIDGWVPDLHALRWTGAGLRIIP